LKLILRFKFKCYLRTPLSPLFRSKKGDLGRGQKPTLFGHHQGNTRTAKKDQPTPADSG
jgi:hypothetical protein